MTARARLIGDGVENPANAKALLDAAAMFGIPCTFRDSRGLVEQGRSSRVVNRLSPSPPLNWCTGWHQSSRWTTLPARPPCSPARCLRQPSIVVGNERRGVRPDVLRGAAQVVQIPMSGRGVNTLNVASAAAVALYYLLCAPRRHHERAARPRARRPSVQLVGPGDHVKPAARYGRRPRSVGARPVSTTGTKCGSAHHGT